MRADELALQHGGGNKQVAVEQAMEPSAAVETVQQDGRVKLRFARRPALHIVMLGLEHEASVLEIVDVVDDLAPVDIPQAGDLRASQFTTFDHVSPPHAGDGNQVGIESSCCYEACGAVSSAQIFQSFSSSFLFLNSHLTSSRSSKNLSVTLSTSGELASQTAVSAPCALVRPPE